MFHILKMATMIAMLAFAAAGVAQARPINFRNDHARPGYASQRYAVWSK
jgi:hypothetical protein